MRLFRKLFRKTPVTKQDVIMALEDFLLGRGGARDWDDFTSIPLDDPELERIRLQCAALPDRYPPGVSSRYCNRDGLAVIEALLSKLRE